MISQARRRIRRGSTTTANSCCRRCRRRCRWQGHQRPKLALVSDRCIDGAAALFEHDLTHPPRAVALPRLRRRHDSNHAHAAAARRRPPPVPSSCASCNRSSPATRPLHHHHTSAHDPRSTAAARCRRRPPGRGRRRPAGRRARSARRCTPPPSAVSTTIRAMCVWRRGRLRDSALLEPNAPRWMGLLPQQMTWMRCVLVPDTLTWSCQDGTVSRTRAQGVVRRVAKPPPMGRCLGTSVHYIITICTCRADADVVAPHVW